MAKLIDGKLTSGEGLRRPRDEEWEVTLPAGGTISWIYRREPQQLGFYEPDGAAIMLIGRDASFDPQGGTLRVLLRFWAASISYDRYVAQVEDGAGRHALAPEELPIFALLGMWLQRLNEPTGGGTGYTA